jgi:hypothetical protein
VIYMTGHSVVETLINDESYENIAVVYDEDRRPYAGLFRQAVNR